MLIMTAKFPAKKVLLLAFLFIIGILAALLLPRSASSAISGSDDAERCAYLSSLGWEVEEAPIETLSISLPEPLAEPYLSYNEMQKLQGFDLSPLAGKTLTRCTYRVNNHPTLEPCQANLYIYEGEIVAGDIMCTGKNGFISDLKFPQQK